MTQDFLYDFISRHKLAVIASLSAEDFPQSALVGFAVASDLRIIFDTLTDSRKYQNLIEERLWRLLRFGCNALHAWLGERGSSRAAPGSLENSRLGMSLAFPTGNGEPRGTIARGFLRVANELARRHTRRRSLSEEHETRHEATKGATKSISFLTSCVLRPSPGRSPPSNS